MAAAVVDAQEGAVCIGRPAVSLFVCCRAWPPRNLPRGTFLATQRRASERNQAIAARPPRTIGEAQVPSMW